MTIKYSSIVQIMIIFVIFASLALTLAEVKVSEPEPDCVAQTCPDIKTLNGIVRGKEIRSKTGKDICAFFGIPFAEPPIGKLRFKPPVPIGNWDGVLEATELPNSCTQPSLAMFKAEGDLFEGELMWEPNTKLSEDCLYLNLWVPADILKSNSNTNAKGKVNDVTTMFWIYGGGFGQGSSTLDVYNGATLAGEENVVVASTQYRLGPLGFLYFGNEEAPGNVGLLDQQLAMEWVHSNIANFGGDPELITMFGESAGAFSISYHMLSLKSKHLFKRAILLSGAATSPLVFEPVESALQFSQDAAKTLGCNVGGNKSQTEIMECLRNMDAMEISLLAYQPKKFIGLNAPITVDGTFLKDTPQNLLNQGQGKRADMIIGTVANEGSVFLHYSFPKHFPRENSMPISYDTFETIMREMFRDRPEYEQDAIISRYTNWKNPDDSVANTRNIIAAAGDYTFDCPAWDLANKWSARGLNVYRYSFNHLSAGDPWGKWMGVKHGDECEYIFGRPLEDPDRPKEERELSRKIMNLFANFARTGVPSPSWAKHTVAYPVYLNLNATTMSDKTTHNFFGPNAEICNFWNVELPKLREFAEENTKQQRNEL